MAKRGRPKLKFGWCTSKTCTSRATTHWKGQECCARCYNRAYMGGNFDEPWLRTNAKIELRIWRARRLKRKHPKLTYAQIARRLGCSGRTIYRAFEGIRA